MKKQFAYGALLSYGAIFFNIISGLLYTPWMVRTVGDGQYALYTLAISVISVFLLDFGIGAAVSKFLSNYYARGEYRQADRFMGIVYKVFIAIAAGIALCLGVFYFLIDGVYGKLTADELQTFKRLFVIVAAYSVVSFPFTTFNGILMANERFISVKACNLGQKVLNVALIAAALLTGRGIYALVLVNALSNLVFIVIKYICIRRQTGLRADFSCRDKPLARALFGFSVWITVSNLAQRCMFNIMPTMITALIGAQTVTLFTLAANMEGYVYTFSEAINGMFLPRISRILVGGQAEKELSALMNRVGRFHVATIGLLYVGFLCVGRQFVDLWMGRGYELIYPCALLLIFPSLLDVPQQVAKTALLAKDIVKARAVVYTVMAVVNVALSLILVPALGVLGAACSICAAYLVRTAAFNVLYRRYLAVDLGTYFRKTYGPWCPVAALTVLAGTAIGRVLDLPGWSGLAVKSVLIAGVYAVLYAVIALKKDERKAVLALLGRRAP